MQMLQVGRKHHLENAVENCAYLCNITKFSDWNAVNSETEQSRQIQELTI